MTRSARHGAPPRSELDAVWRLIVELVMETRGEWRRKVAAATELPFSRVRALWRLEDGPRTLASLAEDLGADAPATTVLVNALEARGLVRRTPHPTDRRAKLVSLTAAGRRMLDRVASITDEPPAPLASLSKSELAHLRRVLERQGG